MIRRNVRRRELLARRAKELGWTVVDQTEAVVASEELVAKVDVSDADRLLEVEQELVATARALGFGVADLDHGRTAPSTYGAIVSFVPTRKHSDETSKYRQVSEEVLAEVARLEAEGQGDRKIANRLNELAAGGDTWKPARADTWHVSSVQRLRKSGYFQRFKAGSERRSPAAAVPGVPLRSDRLQASRGREAAEAHGEKGAGVS